MAFKDAAAQAAADDTAAAQAAADDTDRRAGGGHGGDETSELQAVDRSGRDASALDAEVTAGGTALETPMTNEQLDEIEEALRDVVDPELGVNIVDLGLVYDLQLAGDGKLTIDMTLTSAACPLTEMIEDQINAALLGPDTTAAGSGQRLHHQLGLAAAVGPGEDHRRRPGPAAGARLQHLSYPATDYSSRRC